MALLDCLEHTPGGAVQGSVIWLHGLGASGYDFAPLVPHMGLQDVRYVFPHAPEAPVTLNQGHVMPSWYDIRSLDHGASDRESEPDIRASAAKIRALIDREVARGVPHERIVLAGFSQGAAMSLYVGMRSPTPLLGVMVMSGYLVLHPTLDAEITTAGTAAPVWFGHGRQDDVVPVAGGRAAFEAVRAHSVTAEWHDYGMGHNVNPEEIQDIRRFLHARFRT